MLIALDCAIFMVHYCSIIPTFHRMVADVLLLWLLFFVVVVVVVVVVVFDFVFKKNHIK